MQLVHALIPMTLFDDLVDSVTVCIVFFLFLLTSQQLLEIVLQIEAKKEANNSLQFILVAS